MVLFSVGTGAQGEVKQVDTEDVQNCNALD